jgi:hypothetical protein
MIKNIIWWSYERASWQWDVLCIVIICFIFLTPKAWFAREEKAATQIGWQSSKQGQLAGVVELDHTYTGRN